MTASTKASRRPAETEHESPGDSGTASAVPSSMTTEFESPNGLDLNNTDPNTESRTQRYEAITLTLAKSASVIPIYNLESIVVTQPNIAGIKFSSVGQPLFHSATA